MNVNLRTDHGVNIFGVFESRHFAKFFTARRHSLQKRWATFTVLMYPTAFPMIQVEPSDLVRHFQGKSQSGHQPYKRRSSHCKVVSISTRNRLEEVQASRIPWHNRILEPTEDGIESHRKQEAARKTACLTPLAMRNCPLVIPTDSTCVVLSQKILHRKREMNSGDAAFLSTWNIQE